MRFKKLLIFFCFSLLLNCADSSKKNSPKIENAEEALYTDLEGNLISISDFKGKKILLNFWATWCTPCLKEMPSMERAQKILQNENFIFLFATTDNVEKTLKFKQNHNYPFQYILYRKSLEKLNIYALPATFIYNSEGVMVKRFDGMNEWDSEELLSQLKAIQ